MAKKQHSIEEEVENWAKGQLKTIKIYPKTDFINPQIEKALKSAPSKKGGKGGNYPDIKCLLTTPDGDLPVMIEVKGTKGALIKLNTETGTPDNVTKKGNPNFTNISKYAVNGAVHYANAIIRNTSYKEVIAVGVNGYYNSLGNIVYEVSAWYLSRHNLFIPKEIDEYTDLSFLLPDYLDILLERLKNINLTDAEIEHQKAKLEDDIERKLKELNQRMQDEMRIVVNQRVQLVTGLIMAGLGVKDGNEYKMMPLQEDDLHGDADEYNSDGAIIMRKVKSYLTYKGLPSEKIDLIVSILSVVFVHSNLEVAKNGESKIHTLYHEIKQDIIPFLTGELHNLDFTGRLFNVLNAWVDVPDGDKNDVVITPRHVTELMAKLCQVDMNSYVWDFATGSGGFLISAMHQMIADAKASIDSPEELRKKISHIKMEQLLGIEKLADIYLLAVLNMILMKDGSANILKADSLKDFNGNYEQGELRGKPFPANVFLLNPPYSASGKGFVFVKKALGMMTHGMAAVLIQENAGSGNGLPYTQEILENNTLLASIKMPMDLFIGKSSVQTAIYVFQVGKKHTRKSVVKFIDFSNDGFSRMNRRHSSQKVNLRDTDHAHERYAEVEKLVKYGRGVNDENLNYFKDFYIEDYITLKGDDWTYSQHKKIDKIPSEEDFRKVVKNYLAWRVSEVIKQDGEDGLRKRKEPEGGYKLYQMGKLFNADKGDVDLQQTDVDGKGELFINSGLLNFGIKGRTSRPAKVFEGNTITVDFWGNAFYRPFPYKLATHNHVFSLSGNIIRDEKVGLYLVSAMGYFRHVFSYANMGTWPIIKDMNICLPADSNGMPDLDYMSERVREIEEERVRELEIWMKESNRFGC